jgi:predicted nucleotidyltransferase
VSDSAWIWGESMNPKERILEKLRGLERQIKANYKVKEIGVFGSFIRGDEGEKSDIDILVEFEEDADLFDLSGLALLLEEKLRRKVDVVPKNALREELRESVLREVATL